MSGSLQSDETFPLIWLMTLTKSMFSEAESWTESSHHRYRRQRQPFAAIWNRIKWIIQCWNIRNYVNVHFITISTKRIFYSKTRMAYRAVSGIEHGRPTLKIAVEQIFVQNVAVLSCTPCLISRYPLNRYPVERVAADSGMPKPL